MILASLDYIDYFSDNHFFFSTGLTLSYKVNGLSFLFVPAGIDLFSFLPRQNDWPHTARLWWGFGLAVNIPSK